MGFAAARWGQRRRRSEGGQVRGGTTPSLGSSLPTHTEPPAAHASSLSTAGGRYTASEARASFVDAVFQRDSSPGFAQSPHLWIVAHITTHYHALPHITRISTHLFGHALVAVLPTERCFSSKVKKEPAISGTCVEVEISPVSSDFCRSYPST